ncbi:hypothetical protein GE21DRAFT_4321 [Neurospora crassa]|uniref:Uncharacterized protein n=1 Tax=Neurospora crassa (strain ATCC 24698 / 74-OR23-1A / CBS 708.71 / DSM 1257 / FGSC 987) TaxID=367110 RepID=Q7RWS5_NEUCR|nr:hypothetical protein NCU00047 [Neurospora crassa OR74A]EAA26922.1 hypothetical protein NCU00047 [Neurospora crassa OR74A]KHE79576.1 hypothetical protein GE21DRAFT_4321 [Neurospora crassa]|eukprot:XP_956158.1 hypothetical protein NCU00047 [Neurospora crassa OR74A]
MSVDNGDLRCKMDDGMGSAGETTKNDPKAHVVKWKPKKRSTMTTAKALGSDMMRRRCDASKLAGWLAGTGPAEGGNNGRTGGKEAKETSGNSPSSLDLARPSHGNPVSHKDQQSGRFLRFRSVCTNSRDVACLNGGGAAAAVRRNHKTTKGGREEKKKKGLPDGRFAGGVRMEAS